MNWKTIIIIAIVLGSVYGLVSAFLNCNPYYPNNGQHNIPDEDMDKAWHWEPSPLWLPSYLLCKIAKHIQGNWAGISYTKSGYLFRTKVDAGIYFITSAVVGGLIVMLFARLGRIMMKRPQAKTDSVESKDLDEA